jgi:hypothetical protein
MAFWSVQIFANPGIADWKVSPHFTFFLGDLDHGDHDPYFSSPHLNVIDNGIKSDANIVYARLKSLLRLISGVSLLTGNKKIDYSSTLYCEVDGIITKVYWDSCPDIELQELSNPFDVNVISRLEKRNKDSQANYAKDVIELIIENEIVREVILLLALSSEDLLYFLINTYKIYETIKNDLKINISNRKVINREELSDDMHDTFVQLLQYTQYINSRNSSGILSRHGANSTPATITSPSTEEINTVLLKCINCWLIEKIEVKYGRRYKYK